MAKAGLSMGEALLRWGYKNTPKKRKQLREICNLHPELCITIKPLRIKASTVKPYLSSHRRKDSYSHIVYAVQGNAHLFPESLHTDEAHLKEYIKNLAKAGIISRLSGKRKIITENYSATIRAEPWLNKRLSERIKCVTDALKPVKPDIVINNSLNCM